MSSDATAKPPAVHANRRLAPGTPALGGRGDLYRAGDGLAGYGDREHRAAGHRRRPPCQPGRGGLGRQCLPDRAGCDAAAARRARRNRRPSAGLSRRPAAVHAGLAWLRLRMVAAQPDGGAGAAGLGRQRHHERQRGAGPLRLPDAYAGPRLRPQRARGRNGVHARADDRLRHPFGRNMAVAVRDQYSLRRDRHLDRPEDPAANAARKACVRSSERSPDRELPRPLLHRHQQRGASGSRRPGRTGAWRGHCCSAG